ncbi:unnamed protein product [Cuscuta epithymum]|uniref:Zinc finger PHD-type domain-containing protein n=1 Tax=Cuscuta epithymum TaxID=186058 RepID=A0AAV0CBB7_9ASTE|nr:unnamed protein product [Cuscuta epithymum]
MVVNGRAMKRMKRRVTADQYDFLTFPSPSDGVLPHASASPFRTNVRTFLSTHALLPPPSSLFPHLLTWQIQFRVGDLTESGGGGDASPAAVFLDIVEEDVARSRSVYCDHCRVVGWSNNPVCAKRYHFIIKADGNSIGGHSKSCASCGDPLLVSESRCKSCNYVLTTEDVEDWMYNQLEDTNHLLHGVVHANGYGHLLRVNGREGGSKVLSGSHIMNFWDRLCKVLGVRKVSVMDVSKKYGLEFRLIHAIMKGHPWYGEWGYQFGTGSFGLDHDAYKQAINNLSSLPLTVFLSQGRKPRTRVQDLISFYQSLSERELVNIRDLFSFLISLIHDAHKSCLRVDDESNSSCKKPKYCDTKALCSWSMNDVLRVEEAMFRVLRAVSGSKWVSWRALRGAVCKAGPPELLDYCLKELKGKMAADGMVVNSRCVSDSGAMEYRLEPGSATTIATADEGSCIRPNYPSEEHLLRDLKCLYDGMLHPHTMANNLHVAKKDIIIQSASTLIDCKKFMKEYQIDKLPTLSNPNNAIQLLCELDLMDKSPPPELLVLSSNATIHDLKVEASKAFQDVYLMFRRFQVEELVGYSGVGDSTGLRLLLGSTEHVRVRGRCLGKGSLSRFRMERGLESWTVDCHCGAKDDDGERMLACDSCGIWQHTRCAGIPDLDAVPARFICVRCSFMLGQAKAGGVSKDELMGPAAVVAAFCNGKGGGGGVGKGLMRAF